LLEPEALVAAWEVVEASMVMLALIEAAVVLLGLVEAAGWAGLLAAAVVFLPLVDVAGWEGPPEVDFLPLVVAAGGALAVAWAGAVELPPASW